MLQIGDRRWLIAEASLSSFTAHRRLYSAEDFMSQLLRLTCLLLIASPFLYAQFGSGLQGTVADPTGAIVPGSRIVVVNVETGVSRETVSSEDGLYRVPSLSPGTYKINASKEGFGKAEHTVVVAVNEIRRVDFTLSVEGVNQ